MNDSFEPAYRSLLRPGELERRAAEGQERLTACRLCPWNCAIDRLAGRKGICQSGARARAASWGAHPGEETCLSGTRGSGTVFFRLGLIVRHLVLPNNLAGTRAVMQFLAGQVGREW